MIERIELYCLYFLISLCSASSPWDFRSLGMECPIVMVDSYHDWAQTRYMMTWVVGHILVLYLPAQPFSD